MVFNFKLNSKVNTQQWAKISKLYSDLCHAFEKESLIALRRDLNFRTRGTPCAVDERERREGGRRIS